MQYAVHSETLKEERKLLYREALKQVFQVPEKVYLQVLIWIA